MQRPSSSLSNHSATSSAGASSTMMRRTGFTPRQRPVPGGPRRPSAKASLPSIPSETQTQTQQQQQQEQPQQQQQEGQQEQREQYRQSQSEQPPSYMQSQHDLHTHRPLHSYTPPPTSAVTSDSSCSHPPMSVFTRAETPSSMSALSPERAMSPAPVLEPLEERSPAHQSPRQASLPPVPSSNSVPDMLSMRKSFSSIPSISKPPTPAPDLESPASSSAFVKPRMLNALPTPLPLQPPPSVDFSSVPISWKALTLDAAQWTFSSVELQAIVSRAIRASAEPSSIRLLPLQMLDEELLQEVERLESERAQATAQYRFTMHRRTMLLQSLNASSGSSSSPSSITTFSANTINLSQTPALSPAADLAQRLAEVSATLDRIAATLVRVSDQLAQIRSLQDVHAASALAVALRKLNASYARRTREVQSLKEKLAATEEERDEAWRVAEEVAMEFDGDEEYDDVVQGNVVNGERAVAGTATFTRASRVGLRIKVPGVGPRVRQTESDPVPEEETENNAADSPSSAPGETANASTTPIPRRRRANSATSRVTAARTRSIRASKASLRFPRKQHESRPPSMHSQHSAQSGQTHPRSRSRANSRANSISSTRDRDASPSSSNVHGPSIPDVPKIPSATELARLASVKSTASASTPLPPLPPMPPPPIETSLSAIGSFLDMTTRPNSATDEKGKSPEKIIVAAAAAAAIDENAEAGTGSNAPAESESLKLPGDAQLNGGTVADADVHIDGDEQHEEVDGSSGKGDETVITAPSLSTSQQAPFSASRIEAKSSHLPETALAKKEIQDRPILQVYPPSWTRPPPDSPVDVARGSGPHRADNSDDDDFEEDVDAEEDELADAFESAYAQTQLQTATRGARVVATSIGYTRSPLRVQHAQSMLPFPGPAPGPDGRALFASDPRSGQQDVSSAMRRSPASDNQIERRQGPFRGFAASSSARRPTSLPSAQGEKPWNYF